MSERCWRCKRCGRVEYSDVDRTALCDACWEIDDMDVPMEPVEVWPEGTVARLREAAQRFYGAVMRAESNGGCYSTTEIHDRRCEIRRKTKEHIGPCTCGRHYLDSAAVELETALLKMNKAQERITC